MNFICSLNDLAVFSYCKELSQMNNIVKISLIFAAVSIGAGCSEARVEELVFRKTLEYDLVELCEEDEACIASVKEQVKPCMEKSLWRDYLEDPENEEELKRFSIAFYACIVDEDGKPYFSSNLQ